MDARTFIERLKLELSDKIGQFEIRIEKDDSPKSLHFFVLSDEFKDVSRASRVDILLKATSEVLGVPMQMRAVGACLTYAEYDAYCVDKENEEEIDLPENLSDGNAAKSI